jgi:hypothetical protein
MCRLADRLDQPSGAETVCPSPIGIGESIDALNLFESGRKYLLGTCVMALITLEDLSKFLLI